MTPDERREIAKGIADAICDGPRGDTMREMRAPSHIDPRYRHRRIDPPSQGHKYALLVACLLISISSSLGGKDALTLRDYTACMGAVGGALVAWATDRRRL